YITVFFSYIVRQWKTPSRHTAYVYNISCTVHIYPISIFIYPGNGRIPMFSQGNFRQRRVQCFIAEIIRVISNDLPVFGKIDSSSESEVQISSLVINSIGVFCIPVRVADFFSQLLHTGWEQQTPAI